MAVAEQARLGSGAPLVRWWANLRQSPNFAGYVFIAPALLYLVLVIAVPLLWNIKLSFEEIDPRTSEPTFIGIDNYAELARDKYFWQSIWTTFVYSVGSTVGHIGIGTLFALMLNARWAGPQVRNLVRGLFILPWLFSLAASALIWGLLYQPLGIINYALTGIGIVDKPIEFLGDRDITLWALVFINVWKFYPFYMVMILGALQTIPEDLYEAARIDGATALQRLRRVTLPMLRPVLVTTIAIDMITTFTAYDLVKIITGGGPMRSTQTVSYYIWQVGFRDVNFGYGAAMSLVMLVLLAVATLLYLAFVTRKGSMDGGAGTDI